MNILKRRGVGILKYINAFLVAVSIFVLLVPFFFLFIIPVTNDITALEVRNSLVDIPLPEKTELVDKMSEAAKISGCGNGMQYFGAILIKSECSLEELKEYYSGYKGNELGISVEKQERPAVDLEGVFLDKEFKAVRGMDKLYNCYIVYRWGSSVYPFTDFDLRGH